MMKVFLILLLAFFSASGASADHHRSAAKEKSQKMKVQPNRLLPAPRPGISNQRAASLVIERYSGSRILGVSLMDAQGPPVYKVRTLSPNGVVRSVFVDGSSGEVFE